MADPLSITASVIGVVTAGFAISSSLYHIVDSFKEAPKEILAFASDIHLTSTMLQSVCELIDLHRSLYKAQLLNVIKDLRWRFKQIQDVIAKCPQPGHKSLLSRFKFLFMNQRITGLMKKLEGVKHTMSLTLSIAQLAENHQASYSHASLRTLRLEAMITIERSRRAVSQLMDAPVQPQIEAAQQQQIAHDERPQAMATWMSLMLSAPNIPLDRRLPSNEIGQIARKNERAVEIYNKPGLRPKPMEGLESTVLVTKDQRPLNEFEVDMVAGTSIVIRATANPDWHVMNTPFMSLGLKALANRLIEDWTTFDIKEFSDETDDNNHLHPETHVNEVRGGDDDSIFTSSSDEYAKQYLNRQPWASEVRPEFAAGEPRTSTGAFRNQQTRPNGPIPASRSVPAGARPPLPDDLASFYSNMSSSPRPAEGRGIFPTRPTQVPEVRPYAYANPPPHHHHSFASLFDEAPRNPVRERHPLYVSDPWRSDAREFDSIPHPGSISYDDRIYGSRPTQDYFTDVDSARHSQAPSMFTNPGPVPHLPSSSTISHHPVSHPWHSPGSWPANAVNYHEPPWDRGNRSSSHPLGHVQPDHIDEPGSAPLLMRVQKTPGRILSEDETERRIPVDRESEGSVPKRGPGTRSHRQKRLSARLTPRKARSPNGLKAEQSTTAPMPHVTFVSKSKSASQGSDRFPSQRKLSTGDTNPLDLSNNEASEKARPRSMHARTLPSRYRPVTVSSDQEYSSDDLAPDQGYESDDVADDGAGGFGQAGQRGTIDQVELFEVESVDSQLRELCSISEPAKKSDVEKPHQLTEQRVKGPVQGPLPSKATTDNDCPSSTSDSAPVFAIHPEEASTGKQDGREIKALSLRRPMPSPTAQKPTNRARAVRRLTAQIEKANGNPNASDSEESMSTFEPQLPPVIDAPAPDHESLVPCSAAWHDVVSPVRPDIVPIYVRGNELGQTWYAGPERVYVEQFSPDYLRPCGIECCSNGLHGQDRQYLLISTDWVSLEALEYHGLKYKVAWQHYLYLNPVMKYDDVLTLFNFSWHLRQVHVSRQIRGRSAMPVPHMKSSPPPPARFFSQLEFSKPIKRLTGAGDWETPEDQEKGGGIGQGVWNAVRVSFDLVCTVIQSIN
ncbi:hypothetical protein BN1708_006058 [Verticillium longisporum]|uniref:Azaphilone pigments biosynthesis cluster protein L N-terminal domain-containing protein n=1 Tax=Verticillium longisporum TaxID=100787 RepID=A0A0G4MHA6_VERLO|nr:hypothetical protein BN1708_006058 [Verticillium longisporum]